MSREIIEKIKKYFPALGGSEAAPLLATKIKNYFEHPENQKFFERCRKPRISKKMFWTVLQTPLLKLAKKRKFRHRLLPRTRRFSDVWAAGRCHKMKCFGTDLIMYILRQG
ncbi:MAG: hypothetical protein J6Q22_16750 [Prevotella sp.]|nr:hypothetical protein [Prevotella sp.]